ncbi:MAG: hypothetical protein A2603_01655 [Bdellovibrionales bacterium RIFOXYD1_FULL_55_31]|nr:MAG: hypothetical protein A2603_01655 [Bdellovibrionales bacterium RIFOXYD1_FULL_55_31]
MRVFSSIAVWVLILISGGFFPLRAFADDRDDLHEPGREIKRVNLDLSDGRCQANSPSVLKLIGAAALIAPAEYFLNVALHEGSHALAVKTFGGKVQDFKITPSKDGEGYVMFGKTEYTGEFSKAQLAIIDIAPKISDILIVGSYAALQESENVPQNKYAQVAAAMVATGAWVDFSQDILFVGSQNDLTKFMSRLGARDGGERFSYKLGYGALALAGGLEIGKGWHRVFQKDHSRNLQGKGQGNGQGNGRMKPGLAVTRMSTELGQGYVGIGIGGSF